MFKELSFTQDILRYLKKKKEKKKKSARYEAYAVGRWVLKQYMYMILVCFHTLYIPMVPFRRFENQLFYIGGESAGEQRLPIFRHKYQMYKKLCFVVPSMMVAVFPY